MSGNVGVLFWWLGGNPMLASLCCTHWTFGENILLTKFINSVWQFRLAVKKNCRYHCCCFYVKVSVIPIAILQNYAISPLTSGLINKPGVCLLQMCCCHHVWLIVWQWCVTALMWLLQNNLKCWKKKWVSRLLKFISFL